MEKHTHHDFWEALSSGPEAIEIEASDCPGEVLLTGLLTGVATPQEHSIWETHVKDCPACVERFALFQEENAKMERSADEVLGMLQRGQALATTLPESSEDFWALESTQTPSIQAKPSQTFAHKTSILATFVAYIRSFQAELGFAMAAAAVIFIVGVQKDDGTSPWQDIRVAHPAPLKPTKRASVRPVKAKAKKSIPLFQAKGGPIDAGTDTVQSGKKPFEKTNGENPEKNRTEIGFYVKRGTEERKGQDNMLLQEDDELRFFYMPAQLRKRQRTRKDLRFVQVFMVDTKGQHTSLYTRSLQRLSAPLHKPGAGMKPHFFEGGAQLDHSLLAERIYICFSSEPVQELTLKKAVATRLKEKPLFEHRQFSGICSVSYSWWIRKQKKRMNAPIFPNKSGTPRR